MHKKAHERCLFSDDIVSVLFDFLLEARFTLGLFINKRKCPTRNKEISRGDMWWNSPLHMLPQKHFLVYTKSHFNGLHASFSLPRLSFLPRTSHQKQRRQIKTISKSFKKVPVFKGVPIMWFLRGKPPTRSRVEANYPTKSSPQVVPKLSLLSENRYKSSNRTR